MPVTSSQSRSSRGTVLNTVGWEAHYRDAVGKRRAKSRFKTKTAAEKWLRDEGLTGRAIKGGFTARWLGPDGKRRKRTGFATKEDARKHLDAVRAGVEEAAEVEAADRPPTTLDAVLDAFLAGYGKGVGTRKGRPPEKGTMRAVTTRLKHVRAAFGDRDPETLTRLEIEEWKLGLPVGVQFDAFRALRRALRWALDQGLVTGDPSARIYNAKPVKHERRDIVPFDSMAEVEAIAAELDPRFAAIPIVLVGTGMRPEELFGLDRSDVEFDHDRQRGRFIVRRRYREREEMPGTKTGAPERVVPFGSDVYAALRAMPPRLDTPVLFPAARGGRIDIEKWRYREWTPALRAAGIPHRTIYTCRHTFITWNLLAGVPAFVVASGAELASA
jgi:integrase